MDDKEENIEGGGGGGEAKHSPLHLFTKPILTHTNHVKVDT